MQKLHSATTPMGEKRSRYTLATQYPGQSGYYDGDKVRAHLAELVDKFGLPARSVARVVGMHEESVVMIMRGRAKNVRTRQALAILQVTHTPTPEQGRVLAIGATRRLQALGALGHTTAHIAEHSTLGVHQIRRVAGGDTTTILYDDWAEIVRVYDLLSATRGTSDIARSRAAKHKHAPPLDWEDYDIDDPRVKVKPSGPAAGTGYQENTITRRGDVARLTRAGLSATEIAVRLGTNVRQVVRDRQWLKANDSMCDDLKELSA